MKKGKPKPYVKKEGNNKKLMIIIVAAIMVFSGLYYVGMANAPETQQKNSGFDNTRIVQYNVNIVGDNVVAGIVEVRPEVVVFAGESARLSEDSITKLMNLSSASVRGSDGEISNSYVFFRFYTDSPQKALEELKPQLDRILGDYTVYRGYIGIQPGDTSMSSQAYLLGHENITTGSLVKVLLMEKTSGEARLGLIGFIKWVIPFGPTVEAAVNDIQGILLSGFAMPEDADYINKSIPSLRSINYQMPLVLVDKDANATARLNISGVDIMPQGNRTILQLVNRSLDAVTQLLDEQGVDYTARDGVLTLDLPADANLTDIKRILDEKNVTNITEMRYGHVILPEEVFMQNNVIQIQGNKNFTALLFPNATAGGEILINLTVLQVGDFYVINAQQV